MIDILYSELLQLSYKVELTTFRLKIAPKAYVLLVAVLTLSNYESYAFSCRLA